MIFFEPSVYGVLPASDLGDPNVVFAPHNYFESIVQGPEGLLDLSFRVYDLLGRMYGTTLWIGEYGSFNDPATNEAWMKRFGALEDRYLFSGGTWWQWEQECGDPHNLQYPPSPEWLEQQRTKCGNARFPTVEIASRPYPLAAPGRLDSLSIEEPGCRFLLTGTTDSPSFADLWMPSASGQEPLVSGSGIASIAFRRVGSGWRAAVKVTGDYLIEGDGCLQ